MILQGPAKPVEQYVHGGAEIPATEPEAPVTEPEPPVVEIPETPVSEGSGTIVVDLTPGNG